MSAVRAGRYRHYKGDEYIVIGVARHSETKEELVVYHRILHPELYVRPVEMFLEIVEVDGRKIPRFQYLDLGQYG